MGDLGNMEINWHFLLGFTVISILGLFLGIYLSSFIKGEKLKFFFGWMILIAAFGMLYKEVSYESNRRIGSLGVVSKFLLSFCLRRCCSCLGMGDWDGQPSQRAISAPRQPSLRVAMLQLSLLPSSNAFFSSSSIWVILIISTMVFVSCKTRVLQSSATVREM